MVVHPPFQQWAYYNNVGITLCTRFMPHSNLYGERQDLKGTSSQRILKYGVLHPSFSSPTMPSSKTRDGDSERLPREKRRRSSRSTRKSSSKDRLNFLPPSPHPILPPSAEPPCLYQRSNRGLQLPHRAPVNQPTISVPFPKRIARKLWAAARMWSID